jgi:peptidoglycan hydrolase CwlO-like protein
MKSLRPAITAFLALVLTACAAAAMLAAPHQAVADTPAEINARIEAISEKEHQLKLQVDRLQGKQDAAQADLDRKAARQRELQAELTAAKAKLARLKKRLAHAKAVLSKRLVEVYKQGEPDIVTVVLESKGFNEMVERATYLERIAKQDQFKIDRVTELKRSTRAQSVKLAGLEQRQQVLVSEVTAERNGIAAKKGRVVARRGPLLAQLSKQRRLLRQASAALNYQPAPDTVNFTPVSGPGGRVTLNSDGSASAPSNAPAAIKAAVAAGNRIARTPYIWGGGHGSFSDRGYDCSGSVSYVLHAAGILAGPMASGPLMSWGSSGPGKWITIYSNPGHVWMTVGGLRFDTSGRSGTGSRWQTGLNGAGVGGFTVRHYPGI